MLGGGERQEHRVAVEAGWYVRLEIEQVGVDVAATLLGPDGAPLFSTDDPDGLQDKEVLAVIASAGGELRLVVTSHNPQAASGAYRVALTARRPAGPGDAERAAAQKAIAEAWRLGTTQEETKKREAILRFQEAIRLWQSIGETEAVIGALNELGIVQSKLSENQAALASFQRALSLSLDIGELEGEAFAHNNLAGISGAFDKAQRLAHYERALALFKQLDNTSEQARVLYGIGVLLRDLGDLEEAIHYLSESLALRQAAGDVRGELITLLALIAGYQSQGEIEKASDCATKALALSRSPGGEGREASVLQALASLQRYRGQLGEAVASLRAARDLYDRAGYGQMEAQALYNLASIYMDLGDYEEAQRSYEQALAFFQGKNPDVEIRILNAIGRIRHLEGDPQAAIGYFERALNLARQRDVPAGISEALEFTGVAYMDRGLAREGLRLLEQALALRRERRERSAEAGTLLEIAKAWQALGDLDRASALFGDALALGKQVGDTGLEAACLFHWAVLDRQRGDLRQALSRIEAALQRIESVRSGVSSEKLRVTFLASKRAWYELYIDLLMRLDEAEPGHGYAAAALEVSERARARGLLDLIAEGRIDVQEGIAPDLKQREVALGAQLSWVQEKLDQELALDPESAKAAGWRGQLDQLGEKMEQLAEEVRRRDPHYAEVRYPTPLRLDQIRELLDDRTALLEYFVGREASFLFVVTHDGLAVHRLPPANELDARVQKLRQTLERPGALTLGRFRMEAGELYKVLLGPMAARLAQSPNLLISPDGPLSFIPFEVLLVDPARGLSYKDLSYLLAEHAISYVPSASVLESLRGPRPALAADAVPPKGLVAFGDPLLPAAQVASAPIRSPASPGAPPLLPGSDREVRAIADLYPRSEVALYLRETATEENVKANPLLQTARRVHFATHGFVDEIRPQLSYLLLTRNPASVEDGRLQVFEIFNLRLSADLVTLSACQTGLGKQVTGEGMVGLTRAFLYAGARSLLVSLWPVSDQSTPDLMIGFYRHLEDMGTKAEALRQAKLQRVKAGEEPYRWAPFILSGDPR
ncbi:MAG TPA: CHAT domain-containing protein [Thermoanaerobaculia bacterium]|nr:CHAT domain-containing protein [Thermoanaerobaculia bacterium]